jgi:hypothetical protein
VHSYIAHSHAQLVLVTYLPKNGAHLLTSRLTCGCAQLVLVKNTEGKMGSSAPKEK